MKTLTGVIKVCLATGVILLTSCDTLMSALGTYPASTVGTDRRGDAARTGGGINAPMATMPIMAGTVGQFHVRLIECTGNASSQNVTAVVAITNNGPNSSAYVGGSSDGTLAIDVNGLTSKPYSSAGTYYEFPSGVMVRVEIPRIQPVPPGTPMFQTLRVSIGSGRDNKVDFRNVPISWTN